MTENVLLLDDADRLMNLEETAKRMRTSRLFVKGLIDAGLLGAVRFGSECRVPKSSLHEFFVEHIGEDLQETLAAALENMCAQCKTHT